MLILVVSWCVAQTMFFDKCFSKRRRGSCFRRFPPRPFQNWISLLAKHTYVNMYIMYENHTFPFLGWVVADLREAEY